MKLCNLCGNGLKLYCDCGNYKLIKCSKCGLLVTDQESIQDSDLYSDEYFTGIHSNFFSDCKAGYEKLFNKSEKLQNFFWVLNKIYNIKSKGKLLDIGCATGVFLDMARRKGYDVVGVDVSGYACDYAKKNFKLDVRCGKLEDIKLKKNTFDIITLWDLLEHVPDPKYLLNHVSKLLKDDSIIFILTVNDDSLMGWLSKWIYYLSLKKFKFFVKLIHPVHHNYHFTERHLKRYLDESGFEVVWKQKSEMPVSNIEQGALVRFMARVLYIFSNAFNLQHEIRVIARKK